MANIFDQYEVWWVTGAQLLYGGETVQIVDGHSKDMVDGLNIRLKAKVESTLPLGVNVTAVPLDINGNPIQNGVTVEEITLEPGSEDNPSVSDLVLEIDIEEGMINVLDGLVIKAECESQQDKQSELRSTQYIYVKDVVLQLPQGVALDLTDNK